MFLLDNLLHSKFEMNDNIVKNLPRSFYFNNCVQSENKSSSLPSFNNHNQNKPKSAVSTNFSLLKRKIFIVDKKGKVIKNVNRSITRGNIYYNSLNKDYLHVPIKKNFNWENEKLKALYKNNSQPISLPMTISLLRNNINVGIK